MRILYLHQYFATRETAGGTRSYEMARRLVSSGHEVTMITSSAVLGDEWAPSSGWHSYCIDGIDVQVINIPYENKMRFFQRIKAFFRFAFGAAWHLRQHEADVVFATSTPLTIIIPALAAKVRLRTPLVFEVRDLWPELPIAIGALRNPITKLIAKWLEWISYHASNHVVALSPGMAEGVKRRGVPSSKITVIPNSCDLDLFDVSREVGFQVRNELGFAGDQPLIVYVGTFGLINGVGYLVKVAYEMRDLLPEARFLLVGDGMEFEKVVALATDLNVLDRNVQILPAIPKEKVPAVLAAATVATSLFIPLEPMWNNSANKFFDALAAGKPLAINYNGWQADLLRETGAGIVLSSNDPSQGAKTLADFVQDPVRLRKASVEAIRLAKERFSRDLLYSDLQRVLEDAAEA